MAIAGGARRFLAVKSQTAHGTKASGLTMAVAPLRNGSIFEVAPILQARADAINQILRFQDYYPVAKVLPWQAAFYIQNPTTAHNSFRDYLRSLLGKETLSAGPPITKKYDVADTVDGGTDTGTVLFGRALTLHEESQTTSGVKIYADEAQDGVVEQAKITWAPNEPLQFEVSGLCSDLKGNQTTVTPVYPDGTLLHHQHVKDTATSGLRIGSANPPIATDNAIFSKATLSIAHKMRYLPFLGNGTTKQVRIPTRDDQISITLEVVMDVEDSVASQYDSFDVQSDWENVNPVNLDFFTFVDANNVLEYKASAATKGCFWESFRKTAQGFGTMQFTGTLRIVPNALTDAFLQLTTAS